MLSYQYTARDPNTGKKVTSVVQADNDRAAAKLVMDQGLTPIEIKLGNTSGGLFGKFGKGKIKLKDKIIFSRQLSTLINAGLPLVQSLRSVADQTSNKNLKIVINGLITDVESGKAFSEALERRPEVFNNIFVSLVAAGEVSGTLDKSLERLANQQEKDAEILSKVKGALIYPIIVLLVMLAVVAFMMVGVLPQVQELYDGLKGVELPLVTKILLAISNAMIKYWWAVLVVLVIAAFFARRWIKTTSGREFADRAKMRVPPFGQLFMKLYMARFGRTATTLVSSGVPIISVLEIVSEAINNVIVSKSISKGIEGVKAGKSLADSLENDPSFLPLVPNMIRIGEQSGSVEQMLERIADYYEKEVDTQIKAVSTIIEPVLMVVLGIVAITIVAAILLPIYSLVGKNVIR